jgi:hypothetical protein
VTGAGAALDFAGSQTLDNIVVQIGAVTGAFLQATEGTLTLGAGTHVRVHGSMATLASGFGQSGEIVNAGSITADDGALLVLGNGSPYASLQDNFVNTGSIQVTGHSVLYLATPFLTNSGTISLQSSTLLLGDASVAELAGIKLQSSRVSVAGTLDATGSTLNVGAGTALGVVTVGVVAPGSLASDAAIVGGTIHKVGNGLQLLGNVSLSDLTFQGVLTEAAPSSSLTLSDVTLQNGAGTQPGTLVVSGSGALLRLEGGLNAGVLDIGSLGAAVQVVGQQEAGEAALLGAGLAVVDKSGSATIGAFSPSDDLVTNIVSAAAIQAGGS